MFQDALIDVLEIVLAVQLIKVLGVVMDQLEVVAQHAEFISGALGGLDAILAGQKGFESFFQIDALLDHLDQEVAVKDESVGRVVSSVDSEETKDLSDLLIVHYFIIISDSQLFLLYHYVAIMLIFLQSY